MENNSEKVWHKELEMAGVAASDQAAMEEAEVLTLRAIAAMAEAPGVPRREAEAACVVNGSTNTADFTPSHRTIGDYISLIIYEYEHE